MLNLLTRFHLLLLTVLTATSLVALFRIPADFAFVARWGVNGAPNWMWPRDLALAGAPVLALIVTVLFAILGALLTKSRLLQSRHVYEPALTVILTVLLSVQMGLLLVGIGSDLDLIRMTAYGLAALLIVVGIVVAEAERNSYAGLRMPWPVRGDRAWLLVHRVTGLTFGLAGAGLAYAAWLNLDMVLQLGALALALTIPVVVAAAATVVLRGN